MLFSKGFNISVLAENIKLFAFPAEWFFLFSSLHDVFPFENVKYFILAFGFELII